MMDETLKSALRKYPLEGWDENSRVHSASRRELGKAIRTLLVEHDQFPVPWDTSASYPGLFVVKVGDRYLGYSGFPGPETDEGAAELPPLGQAVEDLVDARNASEVILDCHFGE